MPTRPNIGNTHRPGDSPAGPTWTPEQEERLRALREAARVEETALAQRHAISVAQLRALEGRGTCPFYSEAIKARLGDRLLASLERTAEVPEGAGGPGAQRRLG